MWFTTTEAWKPDVDLEFMTTDQRFLREYQQDYKLKLN